VPIPVVHEEVEELGAEELVEAPLAVALMDEPALELPPLTRASAPSASNGQVAALESRVRQLEGSLRDILQSLNELTNKVKSQLGR